MKKNSTLPANLFRNGFRYNLVQRGQRSCIYRQDVAPGICYWEVFKLKIRPTWTIKGKIIPTKEVFPGDDAFSLWAWSYRSYEKAMEKYEEVENIEEGGKP